VIRLSLVLVAALAASAQANVWDRATDDTSEATRDRYETALHDGDELAARANAKSNNVRTINALVDEAIAQYKIAAAARPHDGEPYFRIASVLESFYTDCSAAIAASSQLLATRPPATCIGNKQLDAARTKQAVDAWDAFEARAPLDPRVSDVLFSRAILRTKLVVDAKDAKPHLEGALKDYTALLDRADGMTMLRLEQVWGNLAETYMMLGKIDEAIEAYQVAIDKGAGSSTHYGKAVALDRDERGSEALEVIRRQNIAAFDEFKEDIRNGIVFYVPAGEEYYYFGLIYEAFGYYTESIAAWKSFIKSGAHPQYQGRAKQHIDSLSVKQLTSPRVRRPPDPFDTYP
jgi:tetratricopeptide (TPR) repeat protein